MLYCIQTGTTIPIYAQIVQRVTHQVASGLLPKGTIVRSVRDVAIEFAINPMTVSKAYVMLVEQGILQRSRGNQHVVAVGVESRTVRKRILMPYVAYLLEVAQDLGFGPQCVATLIGESPT